MKPILFSKTSTTFTTNGLGRLDAISCKVIEERNGAFELEMEIAETADHASQIEADSIIVAKPSQADSLQPFRVYKLTKPINGKFTVLARHISYELNVITTMPFEIAAGTAACANTLTALKSNAVGTCPFNFSTDVVTYSSYKQTVPASIRNRIGGSEGSVLDRFGGELKWDKYNVYLYNHRGVQTPQVTLRYGKNIIDFNQEENIENTITGIVPYWIDSTGSDIVTLTEKVIEIQNASSFPYKKTVPHDFSKDFDEKPTEAQLKAKAQAYVGTSGMGVPKVSIKLSFVNLSDTVDYKDIAAFQSVSLCDNVAVQFEKLGINTTAEVIKTDYDVLREKYNYVEIGSLRDTLVTTISGAIKDIDGVGELIIDSNSSVLSEAKGYANNVAGDAESSAKGYADGVASAAESSAKGYADGVASSAESAAKDYADGKASAAESSAKDYADGKASAAESSAKSYADGKASAAETAAKGYTDTKLQSYPTNNDLTLALDTATGWLTSSDGKVMARKDANGDWKELFFLSATATQNSGNVLRINENGIGFGRNGWGGSFTQAWTLDGKLVIGGTNVPELTVYTSDNTQTRQILFKVSRDGITWNLANSSMSQNGTLTIKNAFIDGGTLAVVDPNWTPAQQGDTPTDADYLFRVNSLGLLWNLANSAMATDGTLTVKNAIVNKGYLRVINPNYESYHDPDPEHIYVYDGRYPDPTIQYILRLGNATTSLSDDSAGFELTTNNLTVDQNGILESIRRNASDMHVERTIRLDKGSLVGYETRNNSLQLQFVLYPFWTAGSGGMEGLKLNGDFILDGGMKVVYDPYTIKSGVSDVVKFVNANGQNYELEFTEGICTYSGLERT